MVAEFWFYATTVLICTGYALLLQSYPQWKHYLSLALAGFVIAGGVLVYFDAKKREDVHTKISQLERMLDDTRKEAETQKSLARDATDRAHVLAEQLKTKTDTLSNVLQDTPQIEGEITSVRLFPWQRAGAGHESTAGKTAAAGVVVLARIENEGAETTLAHWELTIELPDHTIVKPQKWPVKKALRIPCEGGSMTIRSDESLDAATLQAVERAGQRSGATIWMVKNIPLTAVQKDASSYTLTARDKRGVVHALKPFNVSDQPQRCFGFEVLE